MNSKLKSSLVILVTLIIGIAIGFELSEIIDKGRFEKMREFRKPRGFTNMFITIIEPDSAQKPLINSILLKYHEKMDSVSKEGMSKVSNLMTSMEDEIRLLLTEEQAKRFDEEIAKFKSRIPPGPRGRPHIDGNMRRPPIDKDRRIPSTMPHGEKAPMGKPLPDSKK